MILITTVGYMDLHPVFIDDKIFSMNFLLVDFALVAYVATTVIYLFDPDVDPLGKYVNFLFLKSSHVLDFYRHN
jgi:hypothetical protein